MAVATPVASTAMELTFEEVYERYLPFVWRSLAALGVPDARIEDATQDVFVAVHARLSSFEARSKLTTWLYAITRNVAVEHIRKRVRERRDDAELANMPRDASPTPEDDMHGAQARSLLLDLVQKLDPAQREVFSLVEIEQIPVKDVAQMLDLKENTVWSRLRLARQAFDAHVARLQARTKDDRR